MSTTHLYNGYTARIGDHDPKTFKDYTPEELKKSTVQAMRAQKFLRETIEGQPQPAPAPDQVIVPAGTATLAGLPLDAQLTAIREQTDLGTLTAWAGQGGLEEAAASALQGKIKMVQAGNKPPPARR